MSETNQSLQIYESIESLPQINLIAVDYDPKETIIYTSTEVPKDIQRKISEKIGINKLQFVTIGRSREDIQN
jgi:hypothetical protein